MCRLITLNLSIRNYDLLEMKKGLKDAGSKGRKPGNTLACVYKTVCVTHLIALHNW